MNTPLNPSKKSHKKLIFLAIGYSSIFLITLYAAYANRLPLEWLAHIPNYDKVGHVVLYCIPSYLGHSLCRQKNFRRGGHKLPVFSLLFALFTVVEELLQGFSPYRTLDAGDLVCSLIGIAAGYWLSERAAKA